MCAIHISHRLCGDDVFLFAAVEPAHPLDGHIVGLSGSTCEEYLPRVSTNQTGYLLQGSRDEVWGVGGKGGGGGEGGGEGGGVGGGEWEEERGRRGVGEGGHMYI